MPSKSSALAETIECIYATVAEPTLWSDALAAASEVCGSDVCILFRQSLQRAGVAVIASHNVSPDIQSMYARHHSRHSPLFATPAKLQSPDGVVLSHEIVSDRDLSRTEFYDDFLRPQNLFYGAAGVVSLDRETVTVLLGVRAKHRKPFRPAERRRLAAVSRSVNRVLQLQSRLAAVSGALDCLAEGVFLTDNASSIVHANNAGQRMLAEGRLVQADGGRLIPGNAQWTRFPLNSLPAAPGATQAVFVSAGPLHSNPFASFGWTPAESRVALLIGTGASVKEVAEQCKLSQHTVRNQLKQAMHKSGSRRQSELVARVVRGLAKE